MERRRRARINESLNELKSLVLTSLNKDHSKFNKMEKADVLELTVNYLKSLKSNDVQQASGEYINYNSSCAILHALNPAPFVTLFSLEFHAFLPHSVNLVNSV